MDWINVDDRLPENLVEVLTFSPCEGISIGQYDSNCRNEDDAGLFHHEIWPDEYAWDTNCTPTHWMPLPDRPVIEIGKSERAKKD